MKMQTKFAIGGFVLGTAIAICILPTQNGYAPPLLVYLLWPAAVFGWCGRCPENTAFIWSWISTLVLLNGVIYGTVAFLIAQLIKRLEPSAKDRHTNV